MQTRAHFLDHQHWLHARMKCAHARTHSHTHVSIWLPVKAVSSELNRWRPFRREKKSPWGGLLTGKCHYSISARWRVPFTQHWLIRAVIFVSLLSVNRLFTKDSFLLHNSSANVLRFHAGATKGPTSHAKLFYALRVSVVVTTTSRSMIDFTSRDTWRGVGGVADVGSPVSAHYSEVPAQVHENQFVRRTVWWCVNHYTSVTR